YVEVVLGADPFKPPGLAAANRAGEIHARSEVRRRESLHQLEAGKKVCGAEAKMVIAGLPFQAENATSALAILGRVTAAENVDGADRIGADAECQRTRNRVGNVEPIELFQIFGCGSAGNVDVTIRFLH